MWYKLKRIMMRPNGVEKQVRPREWDWGTITGFSYDNKTGSVPQSTYGDCNAITFKPDWTKLYTAWEAKNTVYQFSLATPRDISTISYDSKSKSISSQANPAESIIFTSDGLTMFTWWWWSSNWKLSKFTLSTAWDVSTASYDSVQSNISFSETTWYKIYNNWIYLFTVSRWNEAIYRYTMSTPRDITTLWNQQTLSFSWQWWLHEVVLNPEWTQLFVLRRWNESIDIYSLSTPRDLSTATLSSSYTITTPSSSWNITAMCIDNDWLNMYLWWWQLNNIYQYSTTTS